MTDILIGQSASEEQGLSGLIELLSQLVDNIYLRWKYEDDPNNKDFFARPVCRKGSFLLKHHDSDCLTATGSLYLILRQSKVLSNNYSFWPVHHFFPYLGPHCLLRITNNDTGKVWFLDVTLKQFEIPIKLYDATIDTIIYSENLNKKKVSVPKIFLGDLDNYRSFYNDFLGDSAGDRVMEILLDVIPNYRYEFLTLSDLIKDCLF